MQASYREHNPAQFGLNSLRLGEIQVLHKGFGSEAHAGTGGPVQTPPARAGSILSVLSSSSPADSKWSQRNSLVYLRVSGPGKELRRGNDSPFRRTGSPKKLPKPHGANQQPPTSTGVHQEELGWEGTCNRSRPETPGMTWLQLDKGRCYCLANGSGRRQRCRPATGSSQLVGARPRQASAFKRLNSPSQACKQDPR